MIHIWMCVDPSPNSRDTPRISVQTRPFTPADFPKRRGLNRGEVWPMREADVDEAVFSALMCAEVTPKESDQIHQQWWDDAAAEGEPPWPTIT